MTKKLTCAYCGLKIWRDVEGKCRDEYNSTLCEDREHDDHKPVQPVERKGDD